MAEGAVIVVSILLAFAVDAWWDERQETKRQEAMAGALALEIQEAGERMDEAIAVHTFAMCNARRWLSVSASTPLDSVASIVRGLTSHRTPNLALSAVEGVLSSGQLATLDDDELRTWISAWPGVKEDFDEEMDGAIRFVRFVVPGYFVSRGLARAAAAEDEHPLYPRESLRGLIGDPGFQSLVRQAYEVHEVFVREGWLVRRTLAQGQTLAHATGASERRGAAGADPAMEEYVGAYEATPETQAERKARGQPPDLSITVFTGRGGLVWKAGDLDPAGLVRLAPDTLLAPRQRIRLEFSREGGEVAGLRTRGYDPCGPETSGRVAQFVRAR